MTEAQRLRLENLFRDLPIVEFHHGDCRGADEEAHDMARAWALIVVGHPPSDPKARAFCEFDAEEPPLPYLKRNSEIVKACDILIAAPAEAEERLRSGTWATVREARRRGKRVYLLLPNGEVS
jgi:hypothetical protein